MIDPAAPLDHARRTMLYLIAMCMASLLHAQAETTCTCSSQLDALIIKVESNYIGHALGMQGTKRTDHDRFCAELRAEAAQANAAACWTLMRRYVDHFQDGHLFISDVWGECDSTYRTPERDVLDPKTVIKGTERMRNPLEGDWYTHDGQPVTILPAGNGSDGKFVAVLTTDTVTGWKKGELKARFRELEDGSYEAEVLNAKHIVVHPAIYQPAAKGARIVRGSLLMMPPFTWVRMEPIQSNACLIDARQPLAPQVFPYGNDSSVWVASLPSCNPRYSSRLDSLVNANDAAISHARLLIIDLRSNEGGSSGMARALRRYLGAAGPSRVDTAQAVVLSSPDNINYFAYMEQDGWIPKGLLPRMKENPHEVVMFSDPDTTGTSEPASDTTATDGGPKHVALLTDRGVVSAGEALCLLARTYPRVKQFGEATAGCIDYQNVTMVYFGCDAASYLLGYPTVASSRSLPLGGYNRTGIVPDVELPTNVSDPYRAIVDWYGN